MRNIRRLLGTWKEGYNVFSSIYRRLWRALKAMKKEVPWYKPHARGISSTDAKFLVNGCWVYIPKGTTFIWGPSMSKETKLCMPS